MIHDIPLAAEAQRLLKLAAKFPQSPFLEVKLSQASTLHEAAGVLLAMWLRGDTLPEQMLNDFLDKAARVAESVMNADYREVVSIETFSLAGRNDGQTRFDEVSEPIQCRLTTTTHSVLGSATYSEAGGMSDAARRELAQQREQSGVYKGIRRLGKGPDRPKAFSEASPLHWR